MFNTSNNSSGSNDAAIDAFLMSTPVGSAAAGALQGLSMAVQFTKQIVSEFEQMFGIGAGRREADIITPYQNQFKDILTSVVVLMSDPNYNNDPATLQAIYSITYNAYQAFDVKLCGYPSFSQWPDGRAARQAHADFGVGGKFFDTPSYLNVIKQAFYDAGGAALVVQRPTSETIGGILQSGNAQLNQIQQGGPLPTGSGGILGGGNTNILIIGLIAILALAAFSGGRS
jgi:hypothetical protein